MAKNTLPLFKNSGKFYVYVYRDPRPKKKMAPIYVGKGTAKNGRADVHWNQGARNRLFSRVLAKIKAMGLTPSIEIVGWYDDENDAFSAEVHLIKKFGRRDLKSGSLCNLTDGGDGVSGFKPSMEHISFLADLARGKPRTQDVKEKIREKLNGHSVSSETREKISKANSGRKLTEEHKEKLRVAISGIKRSDETKEKLSKIKKELSSTEEFKIKMSKIHKGKIVSDETKEKIRKARANQVISHSQASREKMSMSRKAVVARKKEEKRFAELKSAL